MGNASQAKISWKDIGAEPYRVMFPTAVLAGVAGAALWPLHFAHVISLYPGQAHARIMTCGLLGGFIFGFLGTAMPRMLSAPKFSSSAVAGLLVLHLAVLLCYAVQGLGWGDNLFLLELLFFAGLLGTRVKQRTDLPPPGFSLAGLALLCALAGAVLGVVEHYRPDLDARLVLLRRLLLYQGFLLFPVLGIGPFLLPRFFGLQSEHAFADMTVPNRSWLKKAALALGTGAVICGSFGFEVFGSYRLAYGLRFGATFFYLLLEFPFLRSGKAVGILGISLRAAAALVALGFLAVALFPAYRVGLLHLSLVGGFSVMAFVVATRVVYGHSGNLERLSQPNRWLVLTVGLMLAATATRASADIWPAITISHYVYGSLAWIVAALVWSWHVIPKTVLADTT